MIYLSPDDWSGLLAAAVLVVLAIWVVVELGRPADKDDRNRRR